MHNKRLGVGTWLARMGLMMIALALIDLPLRDEAGIGLLVGLGIWYANDA